MKFLKRFGWIFLLLLFFVSLHTIANAEGVGYVNCSFSQEGIDGELCEYLHRQYNGEIEEFVWEDDVPGFSMPLQYCSSDGCLDIFLPYEPDTLPGTDPSPEETTQPKETNPPVVEETTPPEDPVETETPDEDVVDCMTVFNGQELFVCRALETAYSGKVNTFSWKNKSPYDNFLRVLIDEESYVIYIEEKPEKSMISVSSSDMQKPESRPGVTICQDDEGNALDSGKVCELLMTTNGKYTAYSDTYQDEFVYSLGFMLNGEQVEIYVSERPDVTDFDNLSEEERNEIFGIKVDEIPIETQQPDLEVTPEPDTDPIVVKGTTVFDKNQNIFDFSELFSDAATGSANNLITSLEEKYQYDIIIMTTNDDSYSNQETFADTIYDDSHFGFGEHNSGIFLLINMETRDIVISTSEDEDNIIFTQKVIDKILDSMVPSATAGKYDEVISTFLGSVREELEKASMASSQRFAWAVKESIFKIHHVLIALIAAFIWILPNAAAHRPVSLNKYAENYEDKDSFDLLNKKDMLLGSHTFKSAKASSNSSGSSRSRSSGTHRGGGSRKF